ncbi:hypothetical protein G7Y29_09255 [Corynebacterium qintianiae]|uniref:Secreted protein n=1 Tax=Corynebacterium qintianiae TaxID=2709392 RepID=A0A7T0KM29_9CORY|nr:hypothetical protein [Corynebacterium qintianiae]QPK83017.1 hypothetical protein G7Y29_09255 [Corynebacterium qintianiae]
MKRTSLIGAALTGALAFAVIPGTAPAALAEDYPAVTADARGHEYFLNQEGTHYLPDRELAEVAFNSLTSEDREKAVEVSRAAVAGLVDSGEAVAPSNAEAADARATAIADAPATEVKPEVQHEDVFGPEHVDTDSEDPVAAGLLALPPVLTVNQTSYYLNADGKTYVSDLARVDAEPTADETDASQALLASNGAEVARQALEAARAAGQNVEYAATPAGANAARAAGAAEATAEPAAAPSQRGIAAETGNNTVSKTLFALVIASVIGAAAFAYGRRFLV